MSYGLPLALLVGMIAFAEGALASEDASSHCVDVSKPKAEVAALMTLLRFYLANEVEALVKNGVRLTVIGRRDRLPDGIAGAIARAEAATSRGETLNLRIAVDYSARDAILHAAGNQRLKDAIYNSGQFYFNGTIARLTMGEELAQGNADHALIVEAIVARDSPRAE